MAANGEQPPRAGQRAGLFVTLEGGEGAGKSLQAAALASRLTATGRSVVCAREPGGTRLGERLREILLDLSAENTPLSPMAEALLFFAARAELVATAIAPALTRGDIVLCDRYSDSTLAYQGFGRALDLPDLEQLNDIATSGLRPDLTVLLDLPAAEGLARLMGVSDRFEREDIAFHERVRRGYRSLARREAGRWLVVDARQPPDAVTDAIWHRLEPLLRATS